MTIRSASASISLREKRRCPPRVTTWPSLPSRAHLLMVILGLAAAVWATRGGRPSRGVLVFLATALTFWLLTGASYIPGREPSASRYQLFDATLLLLIAAELLRGVRLGRRATAVLIVAGLAVAISNASVLRFGFKFMSDHAGYAKSIGEGCASADGLAPGGHATCTITNNDISPRLTVIKHVVNDNGGSVTASAFTLTATGSAIPGGSKSVTGTEAPGVTFDVSVGSYSVTETSASGYKQISAVGCSGTAASSGKAAT